MDSVHLARSYIGFCGKGTGAPLERIVQFSEVYVTRFR